LAHWRASWTATWDLSLLGIRVSREIFALDIGSTCPPPVVYDESVS